MLLLHASWHASWNPIKSVEANPVDNIGIDQGVEFKDWEKDDQTLPPVPTKNKDQLARLENEIKGHSSNENKDDDPQFALHKIIRNITVAEEIARLEKNKKVLSGQLKDLKNTKSFSSKISLLLRVQEFLSSIGIAIAYSPENLQAEPEDCAKMLKRIGLKYEPKCSTVIEIGSQIDNAPYGVRSDREKGWYDGPDLIGEVWAPKARDLYALSWQNYCAPELPDPSVDDPFYSTIKQFDDDNQNNTDLSNSIRGFLHLFAPDLAEQPSLASVASVFFNPSFNFSYEDRKSNMDYLFRFIKFFFENDEKTQLIRDFFTKEKEKAEADDDYPLLENILQDPEDDDYEKNCQTVTKNLRALLTEDQRRYWNFLNRLQPPYSEDYDDRDVRDLFRFSLMQIMCQLPQKIIKAFIEKAIQMKDPSKPKNENTITLSEEQQNKVINAATSELISLYNFISETIKAKNSINLLAYMGPQTILQTMFNGANKQDPQAWWNSLEQRISDFEKSEWNKDYAEYQTEKSKREKELEDSRKKSQEETEQRRREYLAEQKKKQDEEENELKRQKDEEEEQNKKIEQEKKDRLENEEHNKSMKEHNKWIEEQQHKEGIGWTISEMKSALKDAKEELKLAESNWQSWLEAVKKGCKSQEALKDPNHPDWSYQLTIKSKNGPRAVDGNVWTNFSSHEHENFILGAGRINRDLSAIEAWYLIAGFKVMLKAMNKELIPELNDFSTYRKPEQPLLKLAEMAKKVNDLKTLQNKYNEWIETERQIRIPLKRLYNIVYTKYHYHENLINKGVFVGIKSYNGKPLTDKAHQVYLDVSESPDVFWRNVVHTLKEEAEVQPQEEAEVQPQEEAEVQPQDNPNWGNQEQEQEQEQQQQQQYNPQKIQKK